VSTAPSAEQRLAGAAAERRKSDFHVMSDRQVALQGAVQMHVGIGNSDAIEVTETAAIFLRFLETGEVSDIQ
jgi:hypothetical protein